MGKRHRENRSKIKKILSSYEEYGFFENEFGELKKRYSKTQCRVNMLYRITLREKAQKQIIDHMALTATNDIQNEMDEIVFKQLDQIQ